jgi:hypothetical protein
MRKLLFVAVLAVMALQSHKAKAMSCYDECYQSYQTCPVECQGTPSQCSDGYQVCIGSCNQGVGPWLIC